MAVEDKYTNANIVAGKKATAAFSEGDKMVTLIETFEVAAADDDGSIYRLFKDINPMLIPVEIKVYNDAITAGTDYDLGFYETTEAGQVGPVIDADALSAAMDMSAGAGHLTPKDGLAAVDIANAQQRLFEIAGQTFPLIKKSYDVAVTANTVGSAAGTVTVVMICVQG